MVLLRNVAEACRAALKARGSLGGTIPRNASSASSAGTELYECLRGESIECILPAEVVALVNKHCNTSATGIANGSFYCS
jgi:hypothetical protein